MVWIIGLAAITALLIMNLYKLHKVMDDCDHQKAIADWLAFHLKEAIIHGKTSLQIQRQGAPIYPTGDSPKRIIRIIKPTIDDILEAANKAVKDEKR